MILLESGRGWVGRARVAEEAHAGVTFSVSKKDVAERVPRLFIVRGGSGVRMSPRVRSLAKLFVAAPITWCSKNLAE